MCVTWALFDLSRYVRNALAGLSAPTLIKTPIPAAKPEWIAHAGGGIRGAVYTNTKEALEENYRKGFRYFELDFSWTSDGHLVAIHDWSHSLYRYYGMSEGPLNYLTYRRLRRVDGLSQLDQQDAIDWFRSHPDAFLVTDIKHNNLSGLRRFRTSAIYGQILPQIYHFEEWEKAKALGFSNIILTLYRLKKSEREVLQFVQAHPLWGITLPARQALDSALPQRLSERGLWVMTHTVNDWHQVARLQARGVKGFYTDFLTPPSPGNKARVAQTHSL